MPDDLSRPLCQNFPPLSSSEIIARGKNVLLGNVSRLPLAFVRGDGLKLWDADGRMYYDFIAGIAVCAFGHAPKFMGEVLKAQADKLIHVSNLFWNEPMVLLAELLTKASGLSRCFFCNSGAEANEAAIKMARKYGSDRSRGARTNIISAANSFHGRTMGAISATGQPKLHEGFQPLLPGIIFVPYGDLDALSKAADETTAAVLLEPVQGEGGVLLPPEGDLQKAAEIAHSKGALLILDEVQTGLGRTGKDFAFRHFGAAPDILTLGKALGSGFPAAADLSTEEAGKALGPGSHSTTVGGAPLGMAAALELCSRILKPEFLRETEEKGLYFKEALESAKNDFPDQAEEVRGIGLLLGLKLKKPAGAYTAALQERGFLVNSTAGNVLRFVPPLIVSREEIDLLIGALRKTMSDLRGREQ